MAKGAILVTGGAGFIGSHTAKALSERGYLPVVFDNLSSGYREAVQWGPLVHGDIRDRAALCDAIRAYQIEAVIHFAGLIEVGRSMVRPDVFFDQNVSGVGHLLGALRDCAVKRLIFSSSAAVYGDHSQSIDSLLEDRATSPSSCYGQTKLVGEWMIANHCRAFGLEAIALRYFNAAGADESGRIGEAHFPETHLIPLAIAAAMGTGGPLTVFGQDFATPDGSCLRDYVHVTDLAAAHVAALGAIVGPSGFEAINLGAGAGRSVLQVIEEVAFATGRPVPVRQGDRRAGDPPRLVADPGKAARKLGWTPQLSSLRQIVADACRWHAAPAFGRTPPLKVVAPIQAVAA